MDKAKKICGHARAFSFVLMIFDIIGQGLSWLYYAGTGKVFDFDMIGAVLSIAGLYFIAAIFGALGGLLDGMQTAAKDQEKASIQRKAILDAVRGTDQSSYAELDAAMMAVSSTEVQPGRHDLSQVATPKTGEMRKPTQRSKEPEHNTGHAEFDLDTWVESSDGT